MSALHSLILSWTLEVVALAFGFWVVWRQFRRGNYWITSALIVALAIIVIVGWNPPALSRWLLPKLHLVIPHGWKPTGYKDLLETCKDLLEAAVAVTALLEFFGFKIGQPEIANPHLEASDLNNRGDMLKLVRARWITGFLESSLGHKTPMDLGLVEVPDALVRLKLMSRIPRESFTPVPPGTPILQVFDQHAGELLILGAPGVGKTTLLLKLAGELLSRAEKSGTERIPVYFHLSSWSVRQPPLADWLITELRKRYGRPEKLAKEWVASNQILPLLDGLDEVPEEFRQACVAAINRFRREKGPATMAVCCREVDYKAIASKLELEGAITVQPLARAEVSTYLEDLGQSMAGVRQLLREDPTLWELLDTPLMVDIVTRAYQNQPIESLKVVRGVQAQRKHLFNDYVNRMFQHRSAEGRYPRERTLAWLGWLATQLFKHSITDFYVEHIETDWLPPRMQRWSKWSVRVVGGLFGVLVVGMLVWAVVALDFSGLVVSGLVVGGLFGGLVAGVFLRMVVDLELTRPRSAEELVGMMLGGMVILDVGGLVLGGLVAGGLLGGLVVIVEAVILYLTARFTLRFLLKIEDLAPLNYPAFLDYTTELLFLYKVGSAYRFRHALFQEYFAELNASENPVPEPN